MLSLSESESESDSAVSVWWRASSVSVADESATAVGAMPPGAPLVAWPMSSSVSDDSAGCLQGCLISSSVSIKIDF